MLPIMHAGLHPYFQSLIGQNDQKDNKYDCSALHVKNFVGKYTLSCPVLSAATPRNTPVSPVRRYLLIFHKGWFRPRRLQWLQAFQYQKPPPDPLRLHPEYRSHPTWSYPYKWSPSPAPIALLPSFYRPRYLNYGDIHRHRH